jgi:acyl-CoA thioester hydrolase
MEKFVNDQPAGRPDKPAAKATPQLADYPHRVAEIIRFGDLDPQGHVNQAVFLTYFESGRVAMFRNPDLGIGVPGVTFVMVRMEVDYMKELRWPGNLEIGTGVAEFGRSSFKAAQAIFHDGVCAAAGRATLVCMDIETRRATPLPEAAIDRLSQWKLRGG